MRHRTKNGLHYVNLCTSSYQEEWATKYCQGVRDEAKTNPESRYVHAFHERGFIWVARRSDNTPEVQA